MEPEMIGADQLAEAAVVLAQAFQNDAGTIYMLPDAEQRKQVLPLLFRVMVRHTLAAGEIYGLGNPLRGVALWLPPGRTSPTDEEMGQAGIGEIVPIIGEEVLGRLVHLTEYLALVHQREITRPHWDLFFLGVEPAWQGQGQGSALIAPMLQRLQAAGQPCYLETLEARNVPFYERNGFRVLDLSSLPNSEVQVWAMLKE